MDKADNPPLVDSVSVSSPDPDAGAFRLSDFHYELPAELIAQAPLPGRSDSRLLVLDASAEPLIEHRGVRDLPALLRAGDHLVFNNTRVVPARLFGNKASGGRLEMMLERLGSDGRVLARIRASKSPRAGSCIVLNGQPDRSGSAGSERSDDDSPLARFEARVVGRQEDLFELEAAEGDNAALAAFIEQHGQIPLPPYIERSPDEQDQERYQTVYADDPGAVAAPTAGLHFDQALFEALAAAGVTHSFVTLHVGAGTFQPVRVEDPSQHVMHAERASVSAETVEAIERARAAGGRIIAVGTTSVRSLEAAAAPTGQLKPFHGETRLFLVPGSTFNVVDAMFTNFHLPESTLLMLVSAFAGLDNTLHAYREAVRERYRFFSYGDAMLVWPRCGVRS